MQIWLQLGLWWLKTFSLHSQLREQGMLHQQKSEPQLLKFTNRENWLRVTITYPICLLCGLVLWWHHNIATSISRGGAAGCGVSGGRGSWAARMLLWIMGVAAMQGLGATPQERIPVSTTRSRTGPLTAPALEAGPTPHCARDGWALPSCRGNHRNRKAVRLRTAGTWDILRGRGGGATCWHYRGRWGGRRGGVAGAREGESCVLLLEQLFQPLAKNPHALPGVLAHLPEGGVLWLGLAPLQPQVSQPHCLYLSSRTWTGAHSLGLPVTFILVLHMALLNSHEQQGETVPLEILLTLSSLHAEGQTRIMTEGEKATKEYSREQLSGDGTVWWRVESAQWRSGGWIQRGRVRLCLRTIGMLV